MGPDKSFPESARDGTFLKDAEGFFNFRPGDFVDRTPIGKGKCGPAFTWLLPTARINRVRAPLWSIGQPWQAPIVSNTRTAARAALVCDGGVLQAVGERLCFGRWSLLASSRGAQNWACQIY